ncbi:MAG: HEPN domain-containing protein [Candidatus Aenigmarchaeota archaeon]|nr:HEPN domain-containing protein [Candidatus Aenigmarchaeota archaeon]
MNEEAKKWMKKAEDDFENAEILLRNKKYDGAMFFSQQAAEKALKAISIEKFNRLRKIHDLVELGKDVNLDKNLLENAKELTMAYIYSRYPDAEEIKDLKKLSENLAEYSRRIVEWVKKSL